MDSEEVSKWIKDDMKKGISAVINGESESYASNWLNTGMVMKFIESEYNAIDLDEFDSNGWEADMWTYHEINGKKYCIAAEGFYGGITFSEVGK